MFRLAHNDMIRTVINGHASVTYMDRGFTFSHQLVLEYCAGFKGLRKLKCLKQATENVDQRMRESLLDEATMQGCLATSAPLTKRAEISPLRYLK